MLTLFRWLFFLNVAGKVIENPGRAAFVTARTVLWTILAFGVFYFTLNALG